jgi:hypothetical protein
MGGKVPHHQLAPRGARSSTSPFTITLRVPCTFAAPEGDPSSGSDGDSNNSFAEATETMEDLEDLHQSLVRASSS